jgi:hypothetical protein
VSLRLEASVASVEVTEGTRILCGARVLHPDLHGNFGTSMSVRGHKNFVQSKQVKFKQSICNSLTITFALSSNMT